MRATPPFEPVSDPPRDGSGCDRAAEEHLEPEVIVLGKLPVEWGTVRRRDPRAIGRGTRGGKTEGRSTTVNCSWSVPRFERLRTPAFERPPLTLSCERRLPDGLRQLLGGRARHDRAAWALGRPCSALAVVAALLALRDVPWLAARPLRFLLAPGRCARGARGFVSTGWSWSDPSHFRGRRDVVLGIGDSRSARLRSRMVSDAAVLGFSKVSQPGGSRLWRRGRRLTHFDHVAAVQPR